MFPLCLKGIRAGPVAAAPLGGPAPRAASPRHLCTQRRRLPRKYSKFLIKTYDCVNSAGWAPNLEKTFRHPVGRPAARPTPGARAQPAARSAHLPAPPTQLSSLPMRTPRPDSAQGTTLTPGASAGRGLEKSFLPKGVRFGSAKQLRPQLHPHLHIPSNLFPGVPFCSFPRRFCFAPA